MQQGRLLAATEKTPTYCFVALASPDLSAGRICTKNSPSLMRPCSTRARSSIAPAAWAPKVESRNSVVRNLLRGMSLPDPGGHRQQFQVRFPDRVSLIMSAPFVRLRHYRRAIFRPCPEPQARCRAEGLFCLAVVPADATTVHAWAHLVHSCTHARSEAAERCR